MINRLLVEEPWRCCLGQPVMVTGQKADVWRPTGRTVEQTYLGSPSAGTQTKAEWWGNRFGLLLGAQGTPAPHLGDWFTVLWWHLNRLRCCAECCVRTSHWTSTSARCLFRPAGFLRGVWVGSSAWLQLFCVYPEAYEGMVTGLSAPASAHLRVTRHIQGFPGGSEVKNLPASAGDAGDPGLIPGLGRSPWRRKWHPSLGFLPRKSHGQRSLVGHSPWGREESEHGWARMHRQVQTRTPVGHGLSPRPEGTGLSVCSERGSHVNVISQCSAEAHPTTYYVRKCPWSAQLSLQKASHTGKWSVAVHIFTDPQKQFYK